MSIARSVRLQFKQSKDGFQPFFRQG